MIEALRGQGSAVNGKRVTATDASDGHQIYWAGTETFQGDEKQPLGMGECQLRDGQGQIRHMYLVVLMYTALMRQLKHDRAVE